MVNITVHDTDRYGPTVVVVADGVNVNQKLIGAGLAWQYRKYCKESFCSDCLCLEENIPKLNIGLWAEKDPVPPWEWRKDYLSSQSNRVSSNSFSSGTGGYHGNLKSHVFHGPSCSHYNCKNCTFRFASYQEAVGAGYRAHIECVN